MMRSRRPAEEGQSSLPTYTSTNGEQASKLGNGHSKYAKHRRRDDHDYPPCCCFQSRRVMLGTAFGFLLCLAFAFVATNVTANASVLRVLGMETDMENPTANQKPTPAVRKWAYAFFLGGLPTIRNNETALAQAGYKGLLYNILVSAKILREAGSVADMILMVHMAEPFASLPPQDAEMLKTLNITTYYVPPTLPSYTNGISTIALEKFRILDFVQYSRVLYLEGDVMPHCNLDYLFELSEPPLPKEEEEEFDEGKDGEAKKKKAKAPKPPKDPLLQENVILSIQGVPVATSMFMLKPWRGHYQRFLRIFTDYPEFFERWNQTSGWGHKFNAKKDDTWLSVADLAKKSPKIRDKWNFIGADLDRGLLYHWVRYIRKKVSIVVGAKLMTISGNDRQLVANPLKQYSCLTDQQEQSGGTGNQWYADTELKKVTSPFGVAPYRDIAQWEHNDNKPWNYKRAPDAALQSSTARQRWFEVLRRADKEHGLNLGLYDPKAHKTSAKDAQGESLNADVPNWNYIPRHKPTHRMPIWSTKVHALKQWALQQTNSETKERLWQPPLLTLPPDAHRQNLFSQKAATPPAATKSKTPPIPCNCSNPILVDPCSRPGQSIEQWLEPRVGLGLSKHSPACPDGARHHMHVVLPFANLNLDVVQAAYCSVQCQDYPSNKLTIYVYEDGAETDQRDAATPPSKVLQHICGDSAVLEVTPPVAASKVASDTKTDEEFDAMSQKWADKTMDSYKQTIEPKKDPMVSNTICLHSNEHSGPGGGKYWAFRLVQARAEANDVVVVLDGDDELNTPKALQIMNRRYVEKSAWMTYGSYAGKYSEQTKAIPRAVLEGKSPFNPRQDQPSWRFGHTRTFKAHLLRHVGRKDFAFKDNSWLVKATDRGFVYRMLELSGPDRVEFISDALYKYKWSTSSSTIAAVPKPIRVANLEHVQSLEPSQRMSLPIHIVIVCWSRVYLLKDQLNWLQEQTLAQNRQLVIHLLSNNPKTHPDVVRTVDGFRKTQEAGSFPNTTPLQVKVVQQKRNWHAFSRFLYVHELRKTEPMDLAIFVDDDQYWVPHFLTSLLSYHDSRGMTTWYGKTFSKKDFFTGTADYWTSDITWSSIAVKNKTDITTFTYGGPGGSVFDSNIWLFDHQLLRLKDDLQQYYEFDDVWVSYVIDALLGWEHRRLPFPLPVDIANINHPLNNVTILPSLPAGQAERLLEMNRAMSEQLKAVATYSGSARGTKTDMFVDMQRQFRWDVTRPLTSPTTKTSSAASKQIGVSPFVGNEATKKTKRAFVCVTGQFDRLELTSKIENLLVPMTSQGYKVQVALVLSHGETTFTNDGYSKLGQLQPKEKKPFYKSIVDAVKDLQESDLNVISPRDAEHGTYEKLANPKVHHEYLMALYEIQKGDRTFNQQKERAQNHPRIYESYQRCLAYAEKAVDNANEKAIKKDPEKANNPYTLETYYDVFFRIREDVGFQDKLSTNMLNSLLEPPSNSVTVMGCRGWHGMNDRFAAVSADAAHTYFQRPYEIFRKEEELNNPKHAVFNPETFLMYSYLSAGINVYANTKLKGITRMYKDAKTGKAESHEGDLQADWCMKGLNHTDHLMGLYGWNVGWALP